MLTSILPVLLALPPAIVDDPLLPLAASLREHLTGRAAGAERDEPGADVALALVALGRERAAGAPLALGADLGRALRLALREERPDVRAGKVTRGLFEEALPGGEDLAMAYHLPPDWSVDGGPWPLVVVVPDPEESPLEHLQLRWTDPGLRASAVLVCLAMPPDLDAWTKVVSGTRAGGLTHVLTGARLAARRFDADADRIWLAGWSEGVAAVLAAANLRPQRFAGVLGFSGEPGPMPPDNLRNVPVLLLAGGARATAFQEACAAAGGPECGVRPSGGPAEAWAWARERPRSPAPTVVTVLPTAPPELGIDPLQPFPTWVDWLRVEPDDPDCLARARLDRERNAVTVETRGVARVSLMLGDHLLDLDRPVRFEIDGRVVERRVERSLFTLLETLHRAESDASRPVVALEGFELGEDVESEGVLADEVAEPPGELSEAEARERGLVRFREEWVHREDARRLRRGERLDPTGRVWLDRRGQERLDGGWLLQDLVWVRPDERALVEQGLWKVGGDWVPLEEAERRRSRLDSMWRIPGPLLLLHTTVPREVAARAREAMRSSYTQLQRVFGVVPPRPLEVTLLRSEEQYDRLAAGDPEGLWPATHRGRLHTIHTAFFAESWFERRGSEWQHRGMGVAYWNSDVPYGDSYGYHAARLALGLSYAMAIDPSPRAVAAGPGPEFPSGFEAEKLLPRWLRHGAAVQAERFFPDERVEEGGDPWWARRWSLENLERMGGLRGLDEVFAFQLEGREREDARRLLIEAGLLVSFLLDGGCAPVEEAHAAFRRALADGRLRRSHVEDLQAALVEHEAELRLYAGR